MLDDFFCFIFSGQSNRFELNNEFVDRYTVSVDCLGK